MANTTTPATSKEQLLERMDEGWRRFREAVRHIGRAKMSEPTGAGWSYHDLIAHIAGWHDLTARRVRAFRTTGTFPRPGDEAALGIAAFTDADEFNARLVSSHRLVGAEALVDELDTTFRALRAEVAELTAEQIQGYRGAIIKTVAANTHGHYDEHAKELGLS
ncbi:MAG: ClbS/DfsB family four-helix bundle protein [Chloroflexota bacterium]|nr:ClbS/DfsB family four-helix bundle protein [Chloroflexota bacterium]